MALGAKSKVRINLVAFLVLGIGLSYLMATEVLSVLQDRYSVFAVFRDAGGVFTNQEVTYRGLTVGQVGRMEVVPEGVRIELLINPKVRIPEEGIEARVMFKSAVGEQFVDLLPASDDAPYLRDGSEIPLEQTSIPVSTQSLLSTLERVLRGVPPKALEGAVDALGKGLTGRGSDIAKLLESTAELAELFARRAPNVQGLLREGTEVGGAFVASREDFERAITELVVVSQTLEASTGDLERLLEGTNLSSDEIVALLRKDREDLNEVIVELAEINDIQAQHGEDLRRLLHELPRALGGVAKTFEPKTGLIRFGLVQEHDRPACSYGTERRRPEDRSFRAPPKYAHCSTVRDGRQSSGPTSSSNGIGGPEAAEDVALPARMADWSWTLLYLNGI